MAEMRNGISIIYIILCTAIPFLGFSQEKTLHRVADTIEGNIEPLNFKGHVYEIFGLAEVKKDTLYTKVDTVYFIDKHENHTLGKEEKIMALITYENGVKVKVVGYFDNGQKYREVEFKDGKNFNGMDTQWYKNGNKFTQAYQEIGKDIFPYLSWYANGSLRSYGDYDKETNRGVIK